MFTSSSFVLLVVAIVLAALMLAFWLTNLIGMPGNWLMLLTGLIYWLVMWNSESVIAITWVTVLVLGLLAIVGELAEFLASSSATKGAGGSKRSVVLALAGSIVGGIVGLFIALPVPIVGPLIGALLFGGLGAFGGAVLGEKWAGRENEESIKVGAAAFKGRIFGTLGKTAIGFLMVIFFLVSLAV